MGEKVDFSRSAIRKKGVVSDDGQNSKGGLRQMEGFGMPLPRIAETPFALSAHVSDKTLSSVFLYHDSKFHRQHDEHGLVTFVVQNTIDCLFSFFVSLFLVATWANTKPSSRRSLNVFSIRKFKTQANVLPARAQTQSAGPRSHTRLLPQQQVVFAKRV